MFGENLYFFIFYYSSQFIVDYVSLNKYQKYASREYWHNFEQYLTSSSSFRPSKIVCISQCLRNLYQDSCIKRKSKSGQRRCVCVRDIFSRGGGIMVSQWLKEFMLYAGGHMFDSHSGPTCNHPYMPPIPTSDPWLVYHMLWCVIIFIW